MIERTGQPVSPALLRLSFLVLLAGAVFMEGGSTGIIPPASAEPADSDAKTEDQPSPVDETHYERLLRTARDGTIAERAAAMKRLGRIGFAHALPVLRTNLDESTPRLHGVALEAVSHIDHPDARNLLIEQMFSTDPVRSVKAAFLLVRRFPEKVVPVLLKGLKHDSIVIRRSAFAALERRTGFRFGYEPDANPSDRNRAIESWRGWWKRNRNRTPEQWWLRQLTPGTGPVSSTRPRRLSAINRLTDMRSWKAVPGLIEKLKHESEAVRVHAIRALRKLTFRQHGYDPLAPADERRQSIGKWKTWWTNHGTDGRISWLLSLMRSEDVEPSRVTDELIRSGDPAAVPGLIERLTSDRRAVRSAAVRALRALTGLTFGYPDAGSGAERKRALRGWTQWWTNRTGSSHTEWMMDMLKEGDTPANRATAASYLKTVRTERAVTALIRHGLTDPEKPVRRAAFRSLQQLTGRTFGYEPDADEEDRADQVRHWKGWWTENRDRFFRRGPDVDGK